uniref:F-box domain-containing protein n=1 Tax=Caenorhabditis tropicalis TaxID=1561998 RepID=A0A1I7UTJ3_9PELO
MNLLRLPFVVLIDVFKNMNFNEKLLMSLLSKRARKTLKMTSVPCELSIFTSEVQSIESKLIIKSVACQRNPRIT